MIARNKQLVRTELGRAIQVYRIDSLVGRQRDDLFDLLINARVDNILGTDHVGLDAFDRIVLGGRNLLQRCRMHDDIDTMQSPVQSLVVTHVADKEAQ